MNEDSKTPGLPAWLLEQIAADAEPLDGAKRIDPPDCGCTDCILGYSRPGTEADERLLATVEAYRKIVELHDTCAWACGDTPGCTDCLTVRALAGIYRSRPGWQEDWA